MEKYLGLVRAYTNGKKCDHCGESIPRDKLFFQMNKNRHVYILCDKCVYILAAKMVKEDPMIKADATAELIGKE